MQMDLSKWTGFLKRVPLNLVMILFWTIAGVLNGYAHRPLPADTTSGSAGRGRHSFTDTLKTNKTIPAKRGVPGTVVSLSSAAARFGRNIGSDDPLLSVPGLFVPSLYGGYDVRISARGYGNGLEQGVNGLRVMVDGVPETGPGGQAQLEPLDFKAIGKIEVERGNSSSLYPSSPGGVVNYISDMAFKKSSVVQYNLFGSFGLYDNGIRAAIKTGNYRLLAIYSYQNYDGFRQHGNGYRHILNLVSETILPFHAKLSILGYFTKGADKLPGSLTKAEFNLDPLQADPVSRSGDEKETTTKGRLAVRYGSTFGSRLNNDFTITAFAFIRFSEQVAADYRIINRYGLGLDGRYVHRSLTWNHENIFTAGFDLFTQPARTEFYHNDHGEKVDLIQQVVSENQSVSGISLSDNFEIIRGKMFVVLSGRLNHTVYAEAQQTVPSLSGGKKITTISPKLALSYKITSAIKLYTSYGYSSDAPDYCLTESPNPGVIFNQDLKPRESRSFELGIRGNVPEKKRVFFKKIGFDAALFLNSINNEIVPYFVNGDMFFRNAARARLRGVELGTLVDIYRGLSLGMNYTRSDFRYTSNESTTTSRDSLGRQVTSTKDFSGNRLPGIPVNNFSVILSWTQPIGRHFDVLLRSTWQGISGLWADDGNTEKTNNRNLLNGVAGMDLKYGKFSLSASGGVNNIFNQVYTGFVCINAVDKRYYNAGAPRNFFVSLNLGFVF